MGGDVMVGGMKKVELKRGCSRWRWVRGIKEVRMSGRKGEEECEECVWREAV